MQVYNKKVHEHEGSQLMDDNLMTIDFEDSLLQCHLDNDWKIDRDENIGLEPHNYSSFEVNHDL